MASLAPPSLPADYQQLCPCFDRQYAEDVAHWANNPELVLGMFYAFIFQDALRFELGNEEDMANLADAVEDYRWAELEAWLDAHRDTLIQRHMAEAPTPVVETAPPPSWGEPPSERKNDSVEDSSDGM